MNSPLKVINADDGYYWTIKKKKERAVCGNRRIRDEGKKDSWVVQSARLAVIYHGTSCARLPSQPLQREPPNSPDWKLTEKPATAATHVAINEPINIVSLLHLLLPLTVRRIIPVRGWIIARTSSRRRNVVTRHYEAWKFCGRVA